MKHSIRAAGLVSFVMVAACGAPPEEPQTLEQRDHSLFVLNTRIWPTTAIPICWQTPGFATEKQWVRDALRQTWERNSSVGFVFSDSCPSGFAGIWVTWSQNTGSTEFLGAPGPNEPGGVNLDLHGSDAAPRDCRQSGFPRMDCITSVAVHEFGHVLSFAHEQNRPGGPVCAFSGAPGNDEIGATEDVSSVMHHCNPVYNNRGQLTHTDILGLRKYYGQPDRDFNGDAKLDLVWHNTGNGQLTAWNTNGSSVVTGTTTSNLANASGTWKPVGTADFNHDGYQDVMWHQPVSGQLSLWLMNNMTFLGSIGTTWSAAESSGWRVVSTGDMNFDGNPDLVWHRASHGQLSFWIMAGPTILHSIEPTLTTNSAWVPFGTGDFNRDGRADVAWFNASSRQVSVWYMDASSQATSTPVLPQVAAPGWTPKTVIDANADGRADIIWINDSSRAVSTWELDSNLNVTAFRTFNQNLPSGANITP